MRQRNEWEKTQLGFYNGLSQGLVSIYSAPCVREYTFQINSPLYRNEEKMKKQTYIKQLLTVVLLLVCASAFADVIYVNEDAGGGNDGSSWDNALTDLQDALALAQSGDMIFVAAGTYWPSVEAGGSGPRYQSFQLINGVAVYGGFAGTETALDQRDIQANETILSGDIGVPDDSSDNCYHVFYHPDGTGLDDTAVLDGFTITAGNADTGSFPHGTGAGMYNENCSPAVTNCAFIGNTADKGGGMLNYQSSPILTGCGFVSNIASSSGGAIFNELSDPSISGCTFTDNAADYGGGGIYNVESSPAVTNSAFFRNDSESGGAIMNDYISDPIVTNCIFSGNAADLYGGGIENFDNCEPAVINCTFSENSADYGGAIDNFDSSPVIINSIMWGDSAASGENEIDVDGGDPEVTFCDIQGGWFGSGGDNIDEDPLFVDAVGADGQAGTGDDDLQLQGGSPCIDAGDNAAVTEATDIKGDPRIIDGDNDGQAIVDVGAHECMYQNPNIPPVADAGDHITAPAGDDCTALVTLDGSGSYDPDGDPLTYRWYYDGQPFAEGPVNEVQLELGEYVFTLIVNDGTEDSEPSDVWVTVYDDAPLELSVTMSHPVLWPANNKMVEVWPIFEVGNGCGGEVSIELVEITCNQPSEKDIQTDDGILLRAKRLGSDKAGRTYTLAYQATDAAGNEVIATAEVKVPHDMGTLGKKKK
jgi:hypothetical protein